MSRQVIAGVLLVTVQAAVALAQSQRTELSLDDLLERIGAYLATYEPRLSELAAEERYEQRIGYITPRGQERIVAERRLTSDVVFLRLPGNGYWYGLRDTWRVDGRDLREAARVDTQSASMVDLRLQAAAITTSSSRHHLGDARTYNMPTVPLDLLQPGRHHLLRFEVGGRQRVKKQSTVKLDFEEVGESTLIVNQGDAAVKTRGSVWVDPSNGSVWRVFVDCGDPSARPVAQPTRPRTPARRGFTLRVEFDWHQELGVLVPSEMLETFPTPNGPGDGRAVYSNYRRFQTGARIVP
jgi:hypothetical protein